VNEIVGYLHSAVLQVSLILVVQGLIFARPLMLWWLGPSCLPGIPVIRMVLLAIPAYMYYTALRSVVDAASPQAYNGRNVLITMSVLIALLAAAVAFVSQEHLVMAVAAATTVSVCVLAIATHRTLQTLQLADRSPQFGSIWLAGLLGTTSVTAQLAFHFQITKPAFAMVVLINVGLAFLFLRKSQPKWLGFVLRVAVPRAGA